MLATFVVQNYKGSREKGINKCHPLQVRESREARSSVSLSHLNV